MLTLGPCINNDATLWKPLAMNGRREGNKREEHSFLPATLLPCQSIGRRSLSTLELECLSFTHQTICFIRFIFSPSDPAQTDRALMMKRRGHPCIIFELACTEVCVCVCECMHMCVFVPLQQCHFSDANNPPHSHHLCHPKNWCHPSLLSFSPLFPNLRLSLPVSGLLEWM